MKFSNPFKRSFALDAAAMAVAILATLYLFVAGHNAFYLLLLLVVIASGAAYFFARPLSAFLLSVRGKRAAAPNPLTATVIPFALLVVLVAAYVLLQSALVGILAFLVLLYLLLNEFIPAELDPDGIRTSAIELVYAFDAAVLAWFFLSAALGTASPIDIVTSCSMTPALQRGDLVLLQGGDIHAPVLDAPSIEDALKGLQVQRAACVKTPRAGPNTAESCTTAFIYNGQTVPFSAANDVIVYEPQPRPAGIDLIIHRAVLRVHTPQGDYYFTKGDNNPSSDQESGIQPTPADRVHGKILARVPYLGYVKLLLFLQFNEPDNCKYQLSSA